MTREWAAEIDAGADLVRSLLTAQFPQFAHASIERVGEGWDNAAYLIDDAYVFRFPRRAIAAPLIATEIAVLPRIAPALPLPISAPCFSGGASDAYPWPFAGYRRLCGHSLSASRLDSAAYETVARELGSFLRALHAIGALPLVESGLPPDRIGRLDHAQRMPKVQARLAELQTGGIVDDARPVIDFLESVAPSGPRPGYLRLVHGDLYARHVLVDGGNVSGIIDWGDVHYGDLAVDVSVAFEILPPAARDAFAQAYGPIDDQTWRLARYRALYHAALVAHYGYAIGSHELLDAGVTGLIDALA